MNPEHFKLNNIEEVKLFSLRLDNYQLSKTGHNAGYLDIIKAFECLKSYEHGGRLFTAILDLKICFVMLNVDMHNASATWNQLFSKGKFEGGTSLDNQLKFNGKFEIQYYYSNFIPRYRAIWDKIMGVLILLFKPDQYDTFRRAKSRKSEFKKIGSSIPQIEPGFIENILDGISDFDEKFRTPEIHGTGTIRKWSFTMLSLHETPLIEFNRYWNWILRILKEIDRIFGEIEIITKEYQ